MTSVSVTDDLPSPATPDSYLTDGTTLASWLLTRDHKRIAILYFISITAFFFVGGAAAALIRINLLTPGGTLLDAETYNRIFTLHGVVMVWLFLVPSIPTTFGNFMLPLMLGARDLAFPRLNLLSWYLFVASGLIVLAGLIGGSVDTGWTFYEPLSSGYSSGALVVVVGGIFINGFSSILTGLNFVVTIHRLRAPGLTWYRLPVFCWSTYATSLILMLATPVLAVTLFLVAAEHFFHLGVFDPAYGGDPILFQHMFWFYSHPAVYIMILPGMGVVSEIIPAFARKKIFGYHFIAWSSVAIAVIGFFVWGHHMFVAGESVYAALVFSFLSFVVAVPSAIKVFNWLATLHKGTISFEAPMLYALGFILLFTIGGLTGLFLATRSPTTVHVTATYFVVAHFHYIMVGGMVSAYFAALHYWWPKITGRLYPESWARFAAVLIFFGFNVTFFPQFILGYLGMPRRYHSYGPELQVWNVLSSGRIVDPRGQPICCRCSTLTWSLVRGPRAPANPWQATGLEWQVPSPPPTENFERTPVVSTDPYDYPGAHRMTTAHRGPRREQYPNLAHPGRDRRSSASLGVYRDRGAVPRRALCRLHVLHRYLHPTGVAAAAAHYAQDHHRQRQHGDPPHLQLFHVVGLARRARRRQPGYRPGDGRGGRARHRVCRPQGRRVRRGDRRAPLARSVVPSRRRRAESRRGVLFPLLADDRHPRAASGDRDRRGRGDRLAGSARTVFPRVPLRAGAGRETLLSLSRRGGDFSFCADLPAGAGGLDAPRHHRLDRARWPSSAGISGCSPISAPASPTRPRMS